jgi:hypothetical protein
MRETLSHAENTVENIELAQIVSKARTSTHAIRAELSGSFQRWEIQMMSMQKYSDDLEREFTLLKQHLISPSHLSEPKTQPVPKMDSDKFTAEEHRSFLDRCLRSIRRDS